MRATCRQTKLRAGKQLLTSKPTNTTNTPGNQLIQWQLISPREQPHWYRDPPSVSLPGFLFTSMNCIVRHISFRRFMARSRGTTIGITCDFCAFGAFNRLLRAQGMGLAAECVAPMEWGW